jgi:hypothetical protein
VTERRQGEWSVHRKEGAKNIAIRHARWKGSQYMNPDEAEAVMLGIGEALGIRPPAVPMRTQCSSRVFVGKTWHQCEAWAEEHAFGQHYRIIETGGRLARLSWGDRPE